MTRVFGFKINLSILAAACVLSAPWLVLRAQTNCVVPPNGLVGWWRAETNTLDQAGTNNGTLMGNASYGTGAVGYGFVLDGTGDAIQVANTTNLRLQNFTIEAWIQRASTTLVTGSAGNNGLIFGYGSSGYGFGISTGGQPLLSKIDVSAVIAGPAITDTNLHHVAVTKSGTAVIFYVDGVASSPSTYSTSFTFGSTPAIGARG